MEIIFKYFESFLKRSVLPSSVLLLFLVLFSLQDKRMNTFLTNLNPLDGENIYASIVIALTLLISLSYIVSIFTQIIFDNNMKENFNSLIFYKYETKILSLLREQTILKLQKENNEFDAVKYTDYFLYQVIGRKLQFLKYPTNTKRYIDDIKSAGSIFIALLTSLFLQLIIHIINHQDNDIFYIPLGIFLMIFVYFIAIEYLLSKYRSRAIRIYTNYLIGDNNPD